MKSSFKFLDAYEKEDAHLFFGRDNEVDDIYHKVFQSNLLLVYGASGTGKTSIVQCGLANRLQRADWFPVFIRRNDNVNKSLLGRLNGKCVTPVPADLPLKELIRSIYLDHFQPIYLIFDQFEELFILGDRNEQRAFYDHLVEVLSADLQCTVILIIREEYLALLSNMELAVPSLFDQRVRIERMHNSKVREVVAKSCVAMDNIRLADQEKFLNILIEKLSLDGLTIELTYLQVYLDKLFQNAIVIDGEKVFNLELIQRTGNVEDVLSQFLEDQVQKMDSADKAWKFLYNFITKDGTKKSFASKDFNNAGISEFITNEEFEDFIQHFVEMKVLRELEDRPGYFEFSHDSLALKTYVRLSAKERNVLEVKHFIEQEFSVYTFRGILLSKESLEYIKPHLSEIAFSIEISEFITQSQQKITLKRKREVMIVSTVTVVLSLLLIAAIVGLVNANQQRDKAEIAERRAEEERERAVVALDSLRLQRTLTEATEKARQEEEERRILEQRRNLSGQIERIRVLLSIGDLELAGDLIRQSLTIAPENPQVLKLNEEYEKRINE